MSYTLNELEQTIIELDMILINALSNNRRGSILVATDLIAHGRTIIAEAINIIRTIELQQQADIQSDN